MPPHLRVYPVHDSSDAEVQAPSVRIPLRDLLPLVAQAHRNNHAWLRDFLDDEVAVTADFYEVLRTFQYYRPSA